jgi:UDP:flavonoid glycosyltransferase YjiC (YdhE family)
MKNITLVAMGTDGDILPMVALGKELTARGHNVVLVAPRNFAKLAAAHNMPFEAIKVDTSQPEHSRTFSLSALGDEIRESFASLEKAMSGCDAVVSTPFQLAAPSLAEYLKIPFFLMMTTAKYVDVIGNFRWLTSIDSSFNKCRAALNLSAIDNLAEHILSAGTIFDTSPFSAYKNVGYQILSTGPWYLERQDLAMPAGLIDFCRDRSQRPTYIGFGSSVPADVESFAATLSDAINLTNVRAVICSGWADYKPEVFSTNCFVTKVAPHRLLFGEVSSAIHHGGAGTTLSALIAGIPQGVVPHVADQVYWGEVVTELGVGLAPFSRKDLTSKSLADMIAKLQDETSYSSNAREFARGVDWGDGVRLASEVIERVGV